MLRASFSHDDDMKIDPGRGIESSLQALGFTGKSPAPRTQKNYPCFTTADQSALPAACSFWRLVWGCAAQYPLVDLCVHIHIYMCIYICTHTLLFCIYVPRTPMDAINTAFIRLVLGHGSVTARSWRHWHGASVTAYHRSSYRPRGASAKGQSSQTWTRKHLNGFAAYTYCNFESSSGCGLWRHVLPYRRWGYTGLFAEVSQTRKPTPQTHHGSDLKHRKGLGFIVRGKLSGCERSQRT